MNYLYQPDAVEPKNSLDELANFFFPEENKNIDGELDFSFIKKPSDILKSSYSTLICQVRCLVANFRRSPLKKEALKQYSKLEF